MEPESERSFAIVLAAGIGDRLGGDQEKAFRPIGGRPILAMAAAAAAESPAIDALIVAAREGSIDRARDCLEGLSKPCVVVVGGATRQASVEAALEAVPDVSEAVAIHDAARPFGSAGLFTAVIGAVREGADGAVPTISIPDTVKRVDGGMVAGTQARDELALAQTPQAFRPAALRDSHARAVDAGLEFTDDSACLEWAGYRVRVVPGEPGNFKITTATDLRRAELLMGSARPPRVGSGFDVHRWEPGRHLWLGGVRFEGETGLAGHSDGDAVCHAAADALLGAAALGDVGLHFPDSDPSIAGIPGARLLAETAELIRRSGFEPSSLDVTIICERPSIGPRRDEIRSALAGALGVSIDAVSVKATRPEGLGLSGDGVGCLATAVVG